MLEKEARVRVRMGCLQRNDAVCSGFVWNILQMGMNYFLCIYRFQLAVVRDLQSNLLITTVTSGHWQCNWITLTWNSKFPEHGRNLAVITTFIVWISDSKIVINCKTRCSKCTRDSSVLSVYCSVGICNCWYQALLALPLLLLKYLLMHLWAVMLMGRCA